MIVESCHLQPIAGTLISLSCAQAESVSPLPVPCGNAQHLEEVYYGNSDELPTLAAATAEWFPSDTQRDLSSRDLPAGRLWPLQNSWDAVPPLAHGGTPVSPCALLAHGETHVRPCVCV